jgi:hypothetical protein
LFARGKTTAALAEWRSALALATQKKDKVMTEALKARIAQYQAGTQPGEGRPEKQNPPPRH